MKEAYSYSLTPDEFAGAVLQRSRRNRPAWPFRIAGTLAVVAFFGAIGFLASISYGRRSVPGAAVMSAIAVLLMAGLAMYFLAAYGARSILRRSTYVAAPRTLYIEPEGIRQAGDKVDVFHRWGSFTGAEIHKGIVYLNLDAVHFYPIPLSAFESSAEAAEFVAHVNEHAAGVSQGGIPSRSSLAGEPDLARAAGSAAADALRIAFFLPVKEDHPSGRWSAIFVLGLLSLAAPILWAFWNVGAQGEWNWYSLSSALLHIPLLLAAAIGTAYALGRPADVPRLLMAGLLVAVVVDFTVALVAALLADQPVLNQVVAHLSWLAPVWLALALGTYACRLVEPGVRRLLVLACCILFLAVPLGSIYRDREIWHAPNDPDDKSDSKEASYGPGGEDVFYKQSNVLAQALQSVRPGRKGIVDVFFIGMAGYGRQDVFRKEVESVTQIFRDRFGADGHVIQLINNPKTLLDFPIASKTSLRAALKRVAEVMDNDEDVLVLYMTSHGSEDHRFTLSLWPLAFHEIDPATLRLILDESGIRNRVVIVSGCYSGGFVKPLESADTLVITASAADRNSFGCSNEAEWTYFGKAYFDDALRGTHSFTKAFETAKPKIAEREKKDKYPPSEPQMALGANIAARLEALENQLEGSRKASP